MRSSDRISIVLVTSLPRLRMSPDCNARTASPMDCTAASYRIRISSTGDADCTRCLTYSWWWFGSGIWTLIDASGPLLKLFCYPHLRVNRRHKQPASGPQVFCPVRRSLSQRLLKVTVKYAVEQSCKHRLVSFKRRVSE